jgi:hypothetical protein
MIGGRSKGRAVPLLAFVAGLGAIVPQDQPRPIGLDPILTRTAAYSDRLESALLDFVCIEKVQETTFQPPGGRFWTPRRLRTVQRKSDYQLIRNEAKSEELRRPIEPNGEMPEAADAYIKANRFLYEKAILGPVGFIGRRAQPFYEYELLGEDKILGRRAFHLRSRPIGNPPAPLNYGEIWVDAATFAVLRIEADPRIINGYGDIQARAAKRKLEPVIRLVLDYGLQRNGLRFPSRFEIDERYKGAFVPLFRHTLIEIEYSDYRFFTVEVAHETKRY